MGDTPRQTAGLWGLGATAWFLGLYYTTLFLPYSPLSVVFQAVVRTIPGPVTTAAIELFGHLALPLAALGVVALSVALAAVVGVAVRPYVGPKWVGLVLGGFGVLVVTAGLLFAGGARTATGLVLGTAVAVAPLGVFVWLAVSPPEALRTGRRSFLRRAGVAAGGALGLGVVGIAAERSSPGAGQTEETNETMRKRDVGRTIPSPTPSRETADGEAFGFDFGQMPPRVGDIENHYIVDKDLINPSIKADLWTLKVGGTVESPYELTHQELLAHDELVDQVVTMVCISNEVGGNLISTVEWKGIPLIALLERAGIESGSYDVVTRAIDGYSESIPVEVARRESILVAVGASGQTLPEDHGFPARLLIPGRYGMKSTKWLTELEVSPRDYKGYWQQRGWEEKAVVNTLSYIRASDVRGDEMAIGGIAYAGLRGIDRVEVSLDGGETWTDAELEAPPSELAWRRWRHVFEKPGSESISAIVRAVDGTGTLQMRKRTSPHGGEGGSTGWHHVKISTT